jgi:CheY-like chemotaxis protein
MIAKSILLAEDDEDDRFFFGDFLQDREDVIMLPPAENGIELLIALNAAKEKNSLPDLIILDQNMPKLNGVQTLERIRQDKRYDSIPVFVYSTYTTDDLVKTCMSIGATLVLAKPADKAGYSDMIDAFFEAANI